MIQLSFSSSLVILLLWPIGIALSMYAYFTARKQGKKYESWFWFGLWCILITFIEWWVWAIGVVF